MQIGGVFGVRKYRSALTKLGFVIDDSKGKGSHCKATHPTRKRNNDSRQFLILVNDAEYGKPTRCRIPKDLIAYGFTVDEILEAFK